MSHFSNEGGHHLCLQSPLNLLNGERRTSYIASTLCQILGFFKCLSHLASEVRVFTTSFSSYVCNLDCYCCWLRTNF